MNLRRWINAWRRGRREEELEREIRSHLELEAEEHRATGLSPDAARYAAKRAFGNSALIKERVREAWGWAFLEQLGRDIRYGSRSLRKNPGFTVTAILTLALGIGANTAIFTLINSIMLRMLPVQNPEQLVRVIRIVPRGKQTIVWGSFSYPSYLQFRDHNQVFSGLLVSPRGNTILAEMGPEAEQVRGQPVSGNYFSVLGVNPILGRIVTDEDNDAARPVVVLSYPFWQRHFAGNSDVVGKQITLNNAVFSVVGVAPRHFQGIDPGMECDFWAPIASLPQLRPNSPLTLNDAGWNWLGMIGRLKSGVNPEQAQANLQVILQQLLADDTHGRSDQERREILAQHLEIAPAANGSDMLRRQFERPLFVLMAIVALILLIACANVANLLLARATARQKEIAVRLAIGASRRRLLRQLLTESLLLALMGAGLGILFAYWGSSALVKLMSQRGLQIALNLTPDAKVLSFTLALTVVTAILFGIAPALLASRADPNSALKKSIGDAAGGRKTLGRLLVAGEVALSLLLVIGAGLFVRTLANLEYVDPGFQREHLLLFSLEPPRNGYPPARRAQLYAQLLARLRERPGILRASCSAIAPITGGGWEGVIWVEGYRPHASEDMHIELNGVENDYFKTLGTPLLLGRDFRPEDAQLSTTAAIINESMARTYFPNQNPIGRHFGWGTGNKRTEFEIVGMTKNSKYGSLREDFHPIAYVYASFLFASEGFSRRTFEVRTAANPLDFVPAVREELRALDPGVRLLNVKSLEEQVHESLHQERLIAILSSFFGALALLLACVGLYGVMAYAVARRTNEIGIRMALGARRFDVVRMILTEALLLAGAGIAVGLPAALASSRLIKSMLYELGTADPITIAAAIFTIGVIAAIASFLPARRASRIDPLVALRYE
jgi:putative ABC transport system permease protein